jgi:hypothetical protein
MILIPLAVGLLFLCLVKAWKREWKNSFLYLQGAVVSFLLYALWAQAHVTDYQKDKIDQLNGEVRDLKNRTNRWTE